MATAVRRPAFSDTSPKQIPTEPFVASPLTLRVIEVLNAAILENKSFLEVDHVNFGDTITAINLGEILTRLQTANYITFFRYPYGHYQVLLNKMPR